MEKSNRTAKTEKFKSFRLAGTFTAFNRHRGVWADANRNEGTVEQNIRAAIKYLVRK